ncbi:hypothetical protein LHJ74_03455 [Streptomyces sp. N2-109]|uniref:Aminoglycoside phosphotransferase domain-containing protein n=1 Tax=Streptomyces gossypii TaxID=2883101 RepID=A0ABT2JP04_9ACTN|nr:hypothetical protein [Streptomyces gossypii]MCT2588999.1 hypothetical protein [Streptomyces gossypii]
MSGPLLRAAARLLDTATLCDPVELVGGRRTTVLRCRTDAGRTVVVKAFGEDDEGRRSFAAEAAGLSLRLAGPELLAVDEDLAMVVMADLGDAPTLADVLLGDDPRTATAGLLALARGLGRLAAASVGRRGDLARLFARYGASGGEGGGPWIAEDADAFPARLTEAGITLPPLDAKLDAQPADPLRVELGWVTAGLTSGHHRPVFTPGDTCPDNNLLTADGLRLIDFEGACFQSVFLTAAYCRMPFSSCWCVFRLPDGLAEEIEQTYRAEVVAVYPELRQDAVWEAGMRDAVAAWTLSATVHLLPHAVREEKLMHPTRRPVPTGRELLRHRWEAASTLPGLPAFTDAMRRLLALAHTDWQAGPLPLYPAFRGDGA